MLSILTLYQTIPNFKDPVEGAFWKHCGKMKNGCNQDFLFFPHFMPSSTAIIILTKLNLLYADAFDLVKLKVLLFFNDLKFFRLVKG